MQRSVQNKECMKTKVFGQIKGADIERNVGEERMIFIASTLNQNVVSRVELEIRETEVTMKIYTRYDTLTLYSTEPMFGSEVFYKKLVEVVKQSTGFDSLPKYCEE